jgi:hypothetical protein
MIKFRHNLSLLLLLTACVSPAEPVPYAEKTKRFNCAEINAEFRYLYALEKNLMAAQEGQTAAGNAGAAILSLGLHALQNDESLTQSGEIEKQLAAITTHRKHMKDLKHEKKCP